jgi:hypothetical protein
MNVLLAKQEEKSLAPTPQHGHFGTTRRRHCGPLIEIHIGVLSHRGEQLLGSSRASSGMAPGTRFGRREAGSGAHCRRMPPAAVVRDEVVGSRAAARIAGVYQRRRCTLQGYAGGGAR